MDNRDRDKVSRNNSSPTDAGEINRETSERESQRKNESDASFGQNIGRSENLENEPSSRSNNSGRSMRGGNSSSEH